MSLLDNRLDFTIENMLEGAYDLHVHAGPDNVERLQDCIDVARDAYSSGFSGVVFKSLFTSTAEWATIVNRIVPEVACYGGLVLDRAVGGLNSYAVESALSVGAKIIWFPVRDSSHSIRQTRKGVLRFASPISDDSYDGISILDRSGALIPDVYPILELIREADVCLATGHLSPTESIVLLSEAAKFGITKLLVTHPCAPSIGATISEQLQMVEIGAKLEHVLAYCMPQDVRALEPKVLFDSMKTVGIENCVLASDFGRPYYPGCIEGMRMFSRLLLTFGLNVKEIRVMACENPALLLGLK
jgi:hypothetical protein